MYNVKLTKQEIQNLLAFLTGKSRLQLTGDEAFEFVSVVNKIANAEDDVDVVTEVNHE